MSEQLLPVIVLYLAFMAYLLSAGAGIRRTAGVAWHVFKFGGGTGAALGVIALLASPTAAARTFLITVFVVSLIWLPIAAMSRARDFLLPRSSVLEVVCLNVLVIVIGEPHGGFPMLRQLLGIVQQALLNPFVLLVPKDLAWLNIAISLWPSVLALWLASKGKDAGRLLRFFPMLWVQIISIVWLLPASIGILLKADLQTAVGHADLLLATLGLVHVLITWVILRDALTMERTTLPLERSEDSTEKIGVARRLADGMGAGPWPPPFYVIAAVLTWLAIRALLSYRANAEALLYGFVGVFIVGAMAMRLQERQGSTTGRIPIWLGSVAVLVASLSWLTQSDLLPAYSKRVNARYSSFHLKGMRSPVPIAETGCELTRDGEWGLRCADRFWSLARLPHPPGLESPAEIASTPSAVWAVDWTGPQLQCHEYEARSTAGSTTFVLLFLPGAWQGSQYLWTSEQRGSCSGFRAVTYKDAPEREIVWEYRWMTADFVTTVGSVQPLESVSSGQEQGAEPE